MLMFAEKEKCHSQVSLCPGPSSLSPEMQLFGPLLAVAEDQSGKSGQFSEVVFNSKQVLFSWVWPENACVKS